MATEVVQLEQAQVKRLRVSMKEHLSVVTTPPVTNSSESEVLF